MNTSARVGVVSDTHGWLDPFLLEAFAGTELIVHAGDIGSMDVIDQLGAVSRVAAVRGNIDGGDLRFFPLEIIEDIAGKRIAALHIAGSPRSPKRAALELLRRESPDIIIAGHSHIPVVGRVEGCLWINPGAAGRSGFHTERYAAILTLGNDGAIGMERILLGPRAGN